MERKRDPAWKHGTSVDAQDGAQAKKGVKVRCNYCSKVVTSITRLKLHLAKLGGGVKSCPSVPETVTAEFVRCFENRPYRSAVKARRNHDMGESGHAGGQSSAQAEGGGSHYNAALPLQNFVDLDPEPAIHTGGMLDAYNFFSSPNITWLVSTE